MVMHNLRGYDSRLIIKQAFEINEQIGNRKIDGISTSNEKFMTFNIGDLEFIDSFQVMASSLDSLVSNLFDKYDQSNNFNHMESQFLDQKNMFCRKGIYPY